MVLARYPLYVAVPPQHPFAEFHSLKREQLADEIFISYRQNALSEYDPTQAILADFADVGLVPNINFQHQAIESILLFVALGKGITIVPEYFLPCAPAGINLLFIPLEDSALPAEVAAIWQEKIPTRRLISSWSAYKRISFMSLLSVGILAVLSRNTP